MNEDAERVALIDGQVGGAFQQVSVDDLYIISHINHT